MINLKRQINQRITGKVVMSSFFLISLIFFFTSWSRGNVPLKCNSADLSINTKENSTVKIRSDGTTMIDGKPFFPFGFYHVSWQSTTNERMKHLKEIAAAGFNTIHASFIRSESLEDYEEFLDVAESLDVYVLTEFGRDNSAMVVNEFKDRSAVLGWSIADDVDDGSFTPKEVLEFHQHVKGLDPNHLTYISGFSDEIIRFANCSDVVAFQSYPIRVGKQWKYSTYSQLSMVRKALDESHGTFYANLQAFNWAIVSPSEFKEARQPTFDEVRNMTYQALLAGVKGIIYYTYHDGAWDLPQYPDLWEGIQSLVPEINNLSPILLEGDLKEIDTGVENVLAGVWILENQALAIIINTSPEKSAEISIELPTNKARAIFSNRYDNLSIEKNKLSGVLTPLDIAVYGF